MEKIKAARERLSMTQAQFADALGVTQSTLSRMETGIIPVTRRTELAIDALLMAASLPIKAA